MVSWIIIYTVNIWVFIFHTEKYNFLFHEENIVVITFYKRHVTLLKPDHESRHKTAFTFHEEIILKITDQENTSLYIAI